MRQGSKFISIQAGERTQAVGPRLYRLLRERIVRGELVPGTRLSEVDVAAAYQVSRQPVREAFIKLSEEALVEIRPQRGTYVSQINVSAVMSARFVREAVEADIVRLHALRKDPALVRLLRELIGEQTKVAEADDSHAFMRLDEEFHRAMASASGHGPSWDILQPLKTQMDRVRYLSARQLPLRQLLAQHVAIVDAVEGGDSAGADSAMRTHLRQILDDLPAVISAVPDYFDQQEAIEDAKERFS
ncbi:GntR family transcriptional regulator [uncultured Nitratireductor sp.]|uniref:GntR family transcriptional regulator n=1 Tax=uncultured Nitratireductor sp. TaxID=520953 RepID=UPI0025D80146|nr:GntR family transcriptional regulator [uncultured Nitratireductor sp.]